MKKLIAKIVTSMTYAHYMESMHKGTFQKNIDEMFRLNGISRVMLPTTIVTEGNCSKTRCQLNNKIYNQVKPKKKADVQLPWR